MEVKNLLLKEVVVSEFNPRKHCDEGRFSELLASIKDKGILVPIRVRPVGKNRYEIVGGERRFKAASTLGLKEIPAVVQELSDSEALEFAIIDNLQREDVHPMEEAEGYEILKEKHGYKNVVDIAAKVGKSIGYIYARIKLCDLIPENRKLFYAEKLSPSVAVLVARIPAHLQKEAGRKIAGDDKGSTGEPMSYRAAKDFITQEYMLRLKDAPFDIDDAMLPGVEAGSCTLCQRRTGNQQELFKDVAGADVCTDPVCFKSKKAGAVKLAIIKAKESGKTVLSEKEAKQVFPNEHTTEPQNGYISLETACDEDKLRRKYKQLVKSVKDAKVVVAVNPHTGALVAMITRAEAARIRKQLEIKTPKPAAKESKKDRVSKAEEKREEKEQVQVRTKSTDKIIGMIISHIRKDTTGMMLWPGLRILANGFVDTFGDSWSAQEFLKRRELEVDRGEAVAALKEHVTEISDSEMLIFCLEFIMTAEASAELNTTMKALCRMYSIDIENVQKTVAEENHTEQAGPAVEVPESEEKAEVVPAAAVAAPKADEPVKIKKRDSKTFEFKGKGGKTVVVKSKADLSVDDAEKAGKAISEVAGLFSEDK